MVLKLQELGFTNAYALLGGLNSWQTAQLPTEMVTEESWSTPAMPKAEEMKKPH